MSVRIMFTNITCGGKPISQFWVGWIFCVVVAKKQKKKQYKIHESKLVYNLSHLQIAAMLNKIFDQLLDNLSILTTAISIHSISVHTKYYFQSLIMRIIVRPIWTHSIICLTSINMYSSVVAFCKKKVWICTIYMLLHYTKFVKIETKSNFSRDLKPFLTSWYC